MRRVAVVGVLFVVIGAVGVAGPAWASDEGVIGTAGTPGVSAGGGHTCGLRTDGSVTCWGDNADGAAPASVAGSFVQISAGAFHGCGIEADSTVACWGSNASGQAPAFVPFTYTQISAGEFHTCGVRTDGTAWCWGDDFAGQTDVPAGTFSQVASGYFHTCGLHTDGTVECWGSNGAGQASAPSGTFTQITAGDAHTCGVKTDSTVACWGYDVDGEAPASVPGTFVQVTAGAAHTCGLTTAGTVTCWGSDGAGQSDAPAGTFAQVSAGSMHTCGVKTDGTVACWGDNSSGQAPASPPNLVVSTMATTTSINSSVTPTLLGQSVSFTATVAAASGNATPTGSVEFKDGTSDLGGLIALTNGKATFTTSSLQLGSHSISAVYWPATPFTSSTSAPIVQQVTYGIDFKSASQPKKAGQTVDIKLSLVDAAGQNRSIGTLVTAVCVVPAGANACGGPGSIPVNGTFDLSNGAKPTLGYSVNTTGMAPGSYALLFTATVDPVVHAAPFQIRA